MSEHEKPQDENTLPPDVPDDPLTGHNYDGIQEYDNPTPAWWSWIFAASVVFAFLYMVANIGALGQLSPEAEYERALLANQKKKFGELPELEPTTENILMLMQEERWVSLGRGVYATHCTSCHGSDAAGSTSAPNLTDDNYIHVKTLADIADVIIKGRGEGKMPGWSKRLSPNEVVVVSAYLASIRGNNLPGKGAEGEVPPEWPEYSAPAEQAESEDEASAEDAS